MRKLKLFSLALMALFSTSINAELTTHTPGTYEKAVVNGGYGIDLTNYAGYDYEVYYFSANSKYGSTCTGADAKQYRLMTADSDSEHILFSDDKSHVDDKNGGLPYAHSCDWIEMNYATTGFAKSDYTYGTNTFNEFFQITPNGGNNDYTKTCFIKPKAGDVLTLKVSGYIEFALLGKDNGDTKYITVSVDGGDNVLEKSTDLGRRAVSLTTGEHTIVVGVIGNSACNIYGFSLKVPASALAPSFTSPASEPAAVYYETNQEADELSVTVDGYPNPDLQWYYKTSKEAADSTKLNGETNTTYTPSTTSEGDFYYYCMASNSEGVAFSKYFHINVTEAVCPSGMTIDGEHSYSEYSDIELTANLAAGNGEISYNWYKGDDLATAKTAGSIGTGTTYTKAACVKGDAGNYFCVATKAGCDTEAASSAFAISITDYVCPTSGVIFSLTMKSGLKDEKIDAGSILPITSDYGIVNGGFATLYNVGEDNTKAQIYHSEAYFGGAQAYIKVDMLCVLEPGDTIAITSKENQNELIFTNTNSRTSSITSSGRKHIVVKDDLLDGYSTFYIWRAGSGGTSVGTIKVSRPAGSATAIENQESKIDNRKFIKDGQLFIEKNGHVYNVFGTCIK